MRKQKKGKKPNCGVRVTKKSVSTSLETREFTFDDACRWFMNAYRLYKACEFITTLIEVYMHSG